MASVNIGEANQGDQFYRYKMPKLQSRIQGRGNGIKTEVVNNCEIAKALERQPEYILKFYGCELGAMTNFDKKTGTSIVNGAHDSKKLIEILEAFIKKYVQCYSCGNPETVVKIKRENIMLVCKACGSVSDVDMRHRLNTYILKNPPEEKISKAEKKLRKEEKEKLKEAAGENLDKEEKKRKKKEKELKKLGKKASGEQNGNNSPGDEQSAEEEEEDSKVEWMTDTSSAAAKARAAEQLSAAMAGMVTQGNIEAEQEAARKKEEKRKAEEEAARKAQEEAERLAREEVERREAAEKQAKEAEEKAKAKHVSPVEELKKSLENDKPDATAKLCDSFDVERGPAERCSLFMQALIGGVADGKVGFFIEKHQAVLKSLAKDKPGQLALLMGTEYVLTTVHPTQAQQILRALKGFYECDIVADSIIVAWQNGQKASVSALGIEAQQATKIRKLSKPFIDYLEEDSDEDSDEESDEE